jgi:hypothetical protein
LFAREVSALNGDEVGGEADEAGIIGPLVARFDAPHAASDLRSVGSPDASY